MRVKERRQDTSVQISDVSGLERKKMNIYFWAITVIGNIKIFVHGKYVIRNKACRLRYEEREKEKKV